MSAKADGCSAKVRDCPQTRSSQLGVGSSCEEWWVVGGPSPKRTLVMTLREYGPVEYMDGGTWLGGWKWSGKTRESSASSTG